MNYFLWVVRFADSAIHSNYFQAILLLKLTYCDKFSMFNVFNMTTWCYDGNEEMARRKLVLIMIDINHVTNDLKSGTQIQHGCVTYKQQDIQEGNMKGWEGKFLLLYMILVHLLMIFCYH